MQAGRRPVGCTRHNYIHRGHTASTRRRVGIELSNSSWPCYTQVQHGEKPDPLLTIRKRLVPVNYSMWVRETRLRAMHTISVTYKPVMRQIRSVTANTTAFLSRW